VLLQSMDYHGCGFLELKDFQWLDLWEPPEFLCSAPDHLAWAQLKGLIMKRYKHPLKAWRNLLDVDGSNSVSWVEFVDACDRMNFHGNIGGAWRALDESLNTSISLLNYSPETARLLERFKDWADTSFGSVKKAFIALDEHHLGHITLPELRRSCQKMKYPEDPKELFECLDVDNHMHSGKKCLNLHDFEFLDDFVLDRHPAAGQEDEIVDEALIKQKPVKKAPTVPVLPAVGSRLMQQTFSKNMMHVHRDPTESVNGDMASSAFSRNTHNTSTSQKNSLMIRDYKQSHVYIGRSDSSPQLAAQQQRSGPSKGKTMQKTQSLPWLTNWLVIDEKMQQTFG